MSTLEIVGGVLILLAAIVTIVVCLLQDQKQQQNMTSAIGGSSNDSFYGKNTGRTKEARLIKVTQVCAVALFVITLAVNVIPVFVK